MESQSQLPRICKRISLLVSDVLDDIGASEELRRHRRQAAINQEIIGTLTSRLVGSDFSCYIFGSAIEGTTTFGLQSDVDYLMSRGNWEVFQDASDINSVYPLSLFLVSDQFLKPGYAKLQIALDGILQSNVIPDLGLPPNETQLDFMGRVVTAKRYYIASLNDERHGPAFTTPASEGYLAKDMVQAFRCHKWPDVALKWFKRIIAHEWPTKELVTKMKRHGFFLVPVGHPYSPEKDIEWRISLSQQERILTENFNQTQFKCYVLLKMLKTDVLPRIMNARSLTSYHCKTCMFYLIETTPSSFWTPVNLLACLQGCLMYLLRWVIEGVCPNYFIPEENMFDGRLTKSVSGKLKRALQQLVSSTFEYLLQIQSDEFGKKLLEKCTTRVRDTSTSTLRADILFIYLRNYSSSTIVRNEILSFCMLSNVERVFDYLLDTVRRLNNMDTVIEHSSVETKRALSLVVPYVELHLISMLVVKQASVTTDREELWKYVACNKWKELKTSSDLLSSRLKQATLMYMLGFKDESFEILDYLLEVISYPPYVVSVCCCRRFKRNLPERALESVGDNFDEFHSNSAAPCIVFLPYEQPLLPTALIYEMIRSVGMPPDSKHAVKDFWYDWAVVDGKFLLYFLLYLHYKDFNFGLEPVYIIFMEYLLQTDEFLGHKETALNILGWVYKQEGQLEKAFSCFQRSLSLQRLHNAAFWHLCVVLCTEINKTATVDNERELDENNESTQINCQHNGAGEEADGSAP